MIFEYCPKCRSRALSLIDQKALQCADCHFVLYLNAAAAVAVILLQKEKIVFMRRAKDPGKGLLDLPGGFAEYGESLEEAIQREVSEELGVAMSGLQYFGSHANQYHYKGITYHTCDAVFTARLRDDQKIKSNEESTAIEWLASDKVPLDEIAFASLREMVRRYSRKPSP